MAFLISLGAPHILAGNIKSGKAFLFPQAAQGKRPEEGTLRGFFYSPQGCGRTQAARFLTVLRSFGFRHSRLLLRVRRRVRLYLAHCLWLEHFFAAIRAFIEFQIRNCVRLALGLACPIPPDSFDFVAATSWTNSDFNHGSFTCGL